MTPSGSTRVAAVIGSPIAHSLSPALHNAAFEAAGLDWVYAAFDVGPGGGAAAVAAARALGLSGLSVTMPLKQEVAAAVDELRPAARQLGAVNAVVVAGDRTVGHNTDGTGFLASLRADAGFDPHGQCCLVIGAGGAARAVILALAESGAAEIVVANRSADRAATAARLAGDRGRAVELGDADIAGAALIVNATPMGMLDTSHAISMPVEVTATHAGQVVVDLVYHPSETAFVLEARARGAVAVGGVGMLVHQAAAAFELWTGVAAPIAAMSAAAERVISERSRTFS